MRSFHYHRLRGFSRLFLDYVEDYNRVSGFFCGNPADDESWLKRFKQCESRHYDRDRLIEILMQQNGESGNRRIITKQIQKLRDPRSVVVITGQQAGLFWGPLYTVYKALSAVRIAAFLEQKFALPVVPLFWIEVDDHDFDEVRHFYIMLPNGEIRRFEYSDGEVEKAIPVKRRQITAELSLILDELASSFGGAQTAEKIIAELREIYQPGRTFVTVFIGFFRRYFPKEPLIFINPGDAAVKRAAKLFYKQAIIQHEAIHRQIEMQTEELVLKKYKPQVRLRTDTAHLFREVNNERSRLEMSLVFSENGKANADRESLAAEFIENEVESLSPDVLLRPLLQDFLVPTAAYIGGPSEISYSAQLKKVYALFEIPMPLVLPRWSGTIVDRKTSKFLKKIKFDPFRILEGDAKDLLPQIAEKATGKQFDTEFKKTYAQLDIRLKEIRKLGATLDSTLVSMVDKSEQKMKYQLGKIQGRFRNALQAADRIAADRSKRVINAVIPENNLQERTFSLLNYILRHGKYFTRLLAKSITIETDKHHLIEY